MPKWIRHTSEPHRLLLAWQAPDNLKNRFRWAVGEVRQADQLWTLDYFLADDTAFQELNEGKPRDLLIQLGFQGYPGFPLTKRQHCDGVREAFMRRLPPKERPDFRAYKAHFSLPDDLHLSDFALLGRTEAKLPNDGFSIVDPLDRPEAESEALMLEIAGFRYYASSLSRPLSLASDVRICLEPQNEHDRKAVMFSFQNEKIGNVNRLQTAMFHRRLRKGDLHVSIERLNGSEASPRAFVFIDAGSESLADEIS